MRAHSMRNNNQILHGDQTRCEEIVLIWKFNTRLKTYPNENCNFSLNMLKFQMLKSSNATRDVFEVVNLLINT